MKRFLLIVLVSLAVFRGAAQNYLPFEQIRKYTRAQNPNRYDSALRLVTNRLGAELHYLYPIYQAVGWEDRFKKKMGEKNFNNVFGEMLAFAGDYSMAIRYTTKSYDSLSAQAVRFISDTVNKLKSIQYASAKTAIITNAPSYSVIMINESHAKPVHRAFTYSLLEDMYHLGYRYLAMEAFNNFSNKCLDSLNVFTGYYTNEPIAGELVRKAIQLGFHLIAYEDTLASKHTLSQRDSVQARNIYSVLQKDPSAKILVHAGYAHIAERKSGDYIPMAMWFKKISGIDPFTIDQTGMTEGSEFDYGQIFYELLSDKFTITEPSVLFLNKRPFNPLDERGYDLVIMHPPTTYLHNRPSWLGLDGARKPALIQPTERGLYFVQAYYANEYDSTSLPFLVPADQTYILNKEGYYCLFLRPGKYKIVFRDVSYKVLAVKDREIL